MARPLSTASDLRLFGDLEGIIDLDTKVPVVQPARKHEVLRIQRRLSDPCLQGAPGGLRNLELHRVLGLVLHDDGACRHLVSTVYVPDPEGYEVASA